MADSLATRVASMTLLDWLDDLTVRFLLNLPPAEMSSMPRLCFQVEEAQWFYEDFVRPANPQLPSLNLRQFCLTLFRHSPLLNGFTDAQHAAAYEEFLAYKVRVPVRGAILMDESMEKVLLVRGWKKGATWSFPRGKINRDEKDLDCAIREVYEETGYDIKAAGLVARNMDRGEVKAIDVTMREQHMRLFVFRGVPLDTHFEPRTRREIGAIDWYNVRDLPGFKKNKVQGEVPATKFYMVAPFLPHLKKWISQQLKKDNVAPRSAHAHHLSATDVGFISAATDDEGDMGFNQRAPAYPQMTSADELKRLISVGGMAHTLQVPQQQGQENTNNLLAMLQRQQSSQLAPAPWPQSGFVVSNAANAVGQTGSYPGGPPNQPQHQMFENTSVTQPQQQPFSSVLQQTNVPDPRMQQTHGQQPSQPFFHSTSRAPQQTFADQQQPDLPAPPTSKGNGLLGLFQQQRVPKDNLAANQNRNAPAPSNAYPVRTPSQPLTASFASFPAGSLVPNAHILQSLAEQIPSHASAQSGSNAAPTVQPRQGQLGAIASGPAAPSASNLPAPKLNTHAMKLLDAFKAPSKIASAAPSAAGAQAVGNGKPHESALLNLFNKAPATTPVPAPAPTAASVDEAVQPPITTAPDKPETIAPVILQRDAAPAPQATPSTQSSATSQASVLQKAAPAKVLSSPVEQQKTDTLTQPTRSRRSKGEDPASQLASAFTTVRISDERPKSSGQLFDPSKPTRPAQTSAKAEQAASTSAAQQRSGSRNASGSPRSSSGQRPAEKTQPGPQFSILQRPGSSAGKTSAPQSPLRNESSRSATFQPQLLKRPGGGAENVALDPAMSASDSSVVAATNDKKDHLLALFGKSASPTATAPRAPPPAPAPSSAQAAAPRENLLNLFNAKQAAAPAAPEAPPVLAQRAPSFSAQPPAANTGSNQKLLLNLFNSSASAKSTSGAPSFSPFISPTGTQPTSLTPIGPPGITRLNSGPQSPTSVGTPTPTEAANKEFLLGYLNGVVRKEAGGGAR